jgi:MFS family permease
MPTLKQDTTPTKSKHHSLRDLPPNLKTSVYDVLAYSLMVGIGETYIAAYALSLGISERSAGLVTVIPILIASVLQLVSHFGIRFFGSRQRWIVLCAIVQATALLYMAATGAFISKRFAAENLFVAASIYWTAALAAGPAWNSWITSIVKEEHRVSFFTQRSKFAQLATLVGLVTAGVILEFNPHGAKRVDIFVGLLTVAAACRYVSAWFIANQKPKIRAPRAIIEALGQPAQGSKLFANPQALPIIAFMFMTQVAVQVSGPYFTPYMLDELHLSYGRYMILLAGVFLGRIVFANFFARVINRYGVKFLLAIGAIGIMPLPFGWLVSDNFYYILALQFIAGIGWGAHELGFTLLLVEQLEENERSKILTIANLLNSIGMFVGSSFGAYILASTNPVQADYYKIFVVSSFARVIPILILPKLMDIPVRPRQIFTRILAVRASGINIIKPIIFKNKKDQR